VQIDLFEQGLDSHSVNPLHTLGSRHRKLLNLDEEAARLASVKLSDGDLHGAVRMLASNDSYVVQIFRLFGCSSIKTSCRATRPASGASGYRPTIAVFLRASFERTALF